MSQSLENAGDGNKTELLVALLSEEMAAGEHGGAPMPLTVVFVERKTKCDEVAAALNEEGIPAVALHGGLGQVGRWVGPGLNPGNPRNRTRMPSSLSPLSCTHVTPRFFCRASVSMR